MNHAQELRRVPESSPTLITNDMHAYGGEPWEISTMIFTDFMWVTWKLLS